jgi:hypothetical protein
LYFYKNEIIISDPHLLSNLEHAGELFLERDSLSRAAWKLAALLKSLLKLLALLSAGLSVWGQRRGESGRMGERLTAGDWGLENGFTGEGDLEFLGDPGGELDGVERGDNSFIE